MIKKTKLKATKRPPGKTQWLRLIDQQKKAAKAKPRTR